MKISAAGKNSTVLFSSKDEDFHLGIELEKSETAILCHGEQRVILKVREGRLEVEEIQSGKIT